MINVSISGSTGSDDPPPPKPARFPVIGASDTTSLASLAGSVVNSVAPAPTTYIVAQNPEVLVQLLRENESRGISPSVYTTPASAFNTLAVDFEKTTTASPSSTTTTPSSQSASTPPQCSPAVSSTQLASSQSPAIYGVSKKVVAAKVSSPPVSVTSSPTTSPSASNVPASSVLPTASPVLRKVSKSKTKEIGPYHSSNSPVVGGVCVLPPPPVSLTNSPPAATAGCTPIDALTSSSLVSSATSDGATLSSTSFTSSYGGGIDLDTPSAMTSTSANVESQV